MKQESRRGWLQFSLRSLLLVMLMVSCFFAGRMSLQRQLNQARAVEAEALRAQEAAMQAEQIARYQADLARAQADFDKAILDGSTQQLVEDSPEPAK
jgi:hypothetical protein